MNLESLHPKIRFLPILIMYRNLGSCLNYLNDNIHQVLTLQCSDWAFTSIQIKTIGRNFINRTCTEHFPLSSTCYQIKNWELSPLRIIALNLSLCISFSTSWWGIILYTGHLYSVLTSLYFFCNRPIVFSIMPDKDEIDALIVHFIAY